MTDEEIKEIATEAEANIKATIAKSIENGVIAEVQKQIYYVINEEAQKFLKDEIVPQIKENLLTEKPSIIKAVAISGETISNILQEALIKQATENLSQSWKRQTIMKALFE